MSYKVGDFIFSSHSPYHYGAWICKILKINNHELPEGAWFLTYPIGRENLGHSCKGTLEKDEGGWFLASSHPGILDEITPRSLVSHLTNELEFRRELMPEFAEWISKKLPEWYPEVDLTVPEVPTPTEYFNTIFEHLGKLVVLK